MNQSTKRIVLCRGQFCNMDRRSDKVLAELQPRVDALNGDTYPPPVRLITANCLSMCGAGPNGIVYPAGTVFNHLTPEHIGQLMQALEETE